MGPFNAKELRMGPEDKNMAIIIELQWPYYCRYVSAEDAGIQETWLWTSVPIYLIQPPSVFQFMALLFSHHHIADRIRDLTIHLPSGCYNTSAPSCHDSYTNTTYLNNRYLDVLTNEVNYCSNNNFSCTSNIHTVSYWTIIQVCMVGRNWVHIVL